MLYGIDPGDGSSPLPAWATAILDGERVALPPGTQPPAVWAEFEQLVDLMEPAQREAVRRAAWSALRGALATEAF